MSAHEEDRREEMEEDFVFDETLLPTEDASSDEAREEEDISGLQDPEIESLRSERDDYLRALQMLQADFENYKKRVTKQQSEGSERANEVLIAKLIPALDTMSLALAHAQEDQGEALSAISQIRGAVFEVLSKEGLEEISPVGEIFNPAEAEAVAHEEGEGGPTVVEVFRNGYRWKGRVLRPAMVKVSG